MAKLSLLTGVAVMVALLMAALPATAFAHDDEVPLICSLTLQVVDPGTDTVKVKDGEIEIMNLGQVAMGLLDCGDLGDLGDHPLDGIVTTDHGSKAKVHPISGAFTAKLKGKLFVETFWGETLEGNIKGKGSGLMLLPGDSSTVVFESFAGEIELESEYIDVEGTFDNIILVPADLVDEFGDPIFDVVVADLGGTPILLINVGDSVTLGMPDLRLAIEVAPGVFVDISTEEMFFAGGLSPLPTLAGGGLIMVEFETGDGEGGDDDEDDDD